MAFFCAWNVLKSGFRDMAKTGRSVGMTENDIGRKVYKGTLPVKTREDL